MALRSEQRAGRYQGRRDQHEDHGKDRQSADTEENTPVPDAEEKHRDTEAGKKRREDMIKNTEVILQSLTKTHGIRLAKRVCRELAQGKTSGARWSIVGDTLKVS